MIHFISSHIFTFTARPCFAAIFAACAMLVAAVPAQSLDYDFSLDASISKSRTDTATAWELDFSLGNETHQLGFFHEGERVENTLDTFEHWLTYRYQFSPSWSLETGLRHVRRPDIGDQFVLAFYGALAHDFDFGATLYYDRNDNAIIFLELERGFLISERVNFITYLEATLAPQSIRAQDAGSGLNNMEIGFVFEFETHTKIVPYIELNHSRLFENTASIARQNGDSIESSSIALGIVYQF